jgi:hypothetical protein
VWLLALVTVVERDRLLAIPGEPVRLADVEQQDRLLHDEVRLLPRGDRIRILGDVVVAQTVVVELLRDRTIIGVRAGGGDQASSDHEAT